MAKSSSKSSKADDVRKLWKLIRRIDVAMMTTACDDGSLRARPMMTQKKEFDGGTLWFFTDVDSAKVHEIEREKHVNLTYADPADNVYVSVSGRASLVRSPKKEKELWRPAYRAWFPQGLNDPKLALLRVDVDRAEYWDSPSSTMVQLAGLVKTTMTGRRPKGGEHKKVKVGMV